MYDVTGHTCAFLSWDTLQAAEFKSKNKDIEWDSFHLISIDIKWCLMRLTLELGQE